jgi:hypothetical protein
MRVPLPPLPPLTHRVAYRPAGRSVVDVLAAEHDRIDALCAMLAEPTLTPRRRRQVAEVLTAVVARHLSAEEQYLYPTVRAVGGARLAEREIAAHAALRHAFRALDATAPENPAFATRSAEVTALLRRHRRAAARDLFPALRSAVDAADLIRLGNRVETAEEAAPTRLHLATPLRPPWNRLIEPAVGLVDKVRDAVTGRRTCESDLAWRPQLW